MSHLRIPMIATSHPNSFRRQIERALGRQRVEVDVRLEADTLPLSLDLIRACGLYAVMPASAVQTYLASDVIAATPVKGQKVSWMLVSLHERSRSTATRALAQLIEARCKSAIDEGAWMTARKSTNSLR